MAAVYPAGPLPIIRHFILSVLIPIYIKRAKLIKKSEYLLFNPTQVYLFQDIILQPLFPDKNKRAHPSGEKDNIPYTTY